MHTIQCPCNIHQPETQELCSFPYIQHASFSPHHATCNAHILNRAMLVRSIHSRQHTCSMQACICTTAIRQPDLTPCRSAEVPGTVFVTVLSPYTMPIFLVRSMVSYNPSSSCVCTCVRVCKCASVRLGMRPGVQACRLVVGRVRICEGSHT